MIRRYVLPIAVPVVVIGGYVFLGSAGGALEDAWQGFVGPLLITYWIGLGFTIAWDVVRDSMHVEGVSPAVVAITGVLRALVIFAMLGGVSAMIDDPWLFGVAIRAGAAAGAIVAAETAAGSRRARRLDGGALQSGPCPKPRRSQATQTWNPRPSACIRSWAHAP